MVTSGETEQGRAGRAGVEGECAGGVEEMSGPRRYRFGRGLGYQRREWRRGPPGQRRRQ
jgi:hypothetical protein